MSQRMSFDKQKRGYQPQQSRSSLNDKDTGRGTTDGDNEALRVQLVQLNERSRWYSTQLWQIPFAFFTIVALAIGLVVNKNEMLVVALTLLALSAFGIAILAHIHGLQDGVRRAVLNLQKVEEQLHLEQTALYKPEYTLFPLRVTVIVTTAGCFLLGGSFYYEPF